MTQAFATHALATASSAGPGAGLTRRVVGGSLWSIGGQCATLLASLVATPFVIRFLGTEAYGVLALINILIGYLAFTDMGMGLASTRFGAEANARRKGDSRSEAAVIWTSLLMAAVPALATAIALALCAPPLVERVLRLPPQLHASAILALRLTALGLVARSLAGVMNTPQLVRLRMDVYTLITSGTSVVQICLVPLVLALGGNLVSVVAVIVGANITALILHVVVSLRLLPALAFPRLKIELMRPLIRFGSAVIISSLVGMALSSAEKLMLTRFVSVAALAHYSIAYTLANLLVVMPAAMNQSLLPALSRLQALEDREPLKELYGRALRVNLLWLVPAVAVVVVSARPFITLWAGPEYAAEAVVPFYILAAGLVFNVMAFVPHSLLTALGQTHTIARYHLAELPPYLIGAVALTYAFGAKGAAVAWSIRVVADAMLLFMATRRVTGSKFALVGFRGYGYAAAIGLLFLPALIVILKDSSLALRIGVLLGALFAHVSLIWRKELRPEERFWVLASLKGYWDRRFGHKS